MMPEDKYAQVRVKQSPIFIVIHVHIQLSTSILNLKYVLQPLGISIEVNGISVWVQLVCLLLGYLNQWPKNFRRGMVS